MKTVTGRGKTGGGDRGAIHGFSRSSRRRMYDYLARLNWGAHRVYFTTLTYHRNWGESRDWKADLHRFAVELARRWGEGILGTIWKLEFQVARARRYGELAPHFHLAIWFRGDPPPVGLFRLWVAETWNGIAQPGDLAALRAGTGVEDAYNTKGGLVGCLMSYLGKYLGKDADGVDPRTGEIIHTGRFWGHWGSPPEVCLAAASLGPEGVVALLRRVRRLGRGSRYLGGARAQSGGRLVFGDGQVLQQLLRGLVGAVPETDVGVKWNELVRSLVQTAVPRAISASGCMSLGG